PPHPTRRAPPRKRTTAPRRAAGAALARRARAGRRPPPRPEPMDPRVPDREQTAPRTRPRTRARPATRAAVPERSSPSPYPRAAGASIPAPCGHVIATPRHGAPIDRSLASLGARVPDRRPGGGRRARRGEPVQGAPAVREHAREQLVAGHGG